MTAERRSDAQLAAQLRELYLEPAPAYRFDVLAQTQHVRQRPRWTFPERWFPMAVLSLPRALAPAAPTRRAIAILAIVALVVAAVVAAIAGAPRYPPPFGLARNGVIVYGLGGDIYTRDSVDAPPRLLIGGDAVDEGPWFSRRGDRFIFYREVPGAYDLYVADADGSDVRRLGGPFDEIETWDVTPDGTTALVSALSESRRWQIHLLPLDGSPGRVLDIPGSATWPRFRPGDGGWISFRRGALEGAGEMFLVRLDGTDLRKLDLRIDGTGGEHDFAHGMAWSDDGTRFAFVSIENDLPEAGVDAGLRIDIATIDRDGAVTDQRRVEFDPKSDNELNPAFLPGTDKLLYNTREGIVDYVSVGVPGVPGGTILKPGTATEEGIDYVISPDGKTAIVLDWGNDRTYEYDLVTLGEGREIQLGRENLSTYQRLAP